MTNLNKKKELHNKRRLASFKECKIDINYEVKVLFKVWEKAKKLYDQQIIQTPPEARPKGFEAQLLNAKIIECVQKVFPLYWRFGKYKRFMLRVNGYIILFKKLNNSDMPMNIKTINVSNISNQLSLPLFNGDHSVEEPILFFGYKKDKFGSLIDPKIVYIDEGKVKWAIERNDIDDGNFDIPTLKPSDPNPSGGSLPKLKEGLKKEDNKVVNK